ncbi:hypothetical protein ABZT47_27830 [Sphaerisporangium sp. NPDC005289]|uniref:hypothetical protein n=1 Tax=Sphaerisporangium sp. NPDC005289 TaxID=3155247 RepID=UPI0033A46DE6
MALHRTQSRPAGTNGPPDHAPAHVHVPVRVRVPGAVLLGVLAGALIAVAAPSAAGAEATAAPRGGAAVLRGGDRGPIHMTAGNGRRNNTYAAIYSPTVVRGQQQVTNTITGGYSRTQTALCTHQRVCVIKQRNRATHRGWHRPRQ